MLEDNVFASFASVCHGGALNHNNNPNSTDSNPFTFCGCSLHKKTSIFPVSLLPPF